MANHNNYAKDRDLMMEAYASVQGKVPATSTTAMPRMLNEAHCDEEHEGSEETVKVELELDKETAEKLHDQLMDEVVEGELPAEDSSCMSDEEHAEDAEGMTDEAVEQMCKEWLKKKWLSFKAEHSEGHEDADELTDEGMLDNWEEVMREYVSDWVEEVVEELS